MTDNAAFWNGLAEKYASQPVADPDAFDRKIEIMKARMTSQDIVLDVGCGTGSLALRLAPAAGHVHGLDLASEMTRIARGKAVEQKVDNVTFHTGPFDASFNAFEPGTLDGVCACSILHLVPDRRAALGRIYGLLKPGGFFVSSTVCLGETWIPYAPILSIMRWLGKAPEISTITVQTLVDEIAAAGFIGVTQPDVGAKAVVGFVVATKPG